MAPGYGIRRAGSSPWPILRPGPRSSLSWELTWRPLGPEGNHELTALIARAEDIDNPPYRTSEQETAEYFLDPTYSGVAGRDTDGVMRTFGLVCLRPAEEIYAFMTGTVGPAVRNRGTGCTLLYWQVERACHLVGAEQVGSVPHKGSAQVPAHVVTTVMADDERMQGHSADMGFEPTRWYREVCRFLGDKISEVDLDGFIATGPWTLETDDDVRHAYNQAMAETWETENVTSGDWTAGNAYFAPQWSFVTMGRPGDRARVAGYLRSGRYEQDWQVLGWREGHTDVLGVFSNYRCRQVGPALLAVATHAYATDGMEYAVVGVDTDNPSGAMDLYESLGCVLTRGTIPYTLDA